LLSFEGNSKLGTLDGNWECAQLIDGRTLNHSTFGIKFATVRRALELVAKELQLRALMGAAHEQRRIRLTIGSPENADRILENLIVCDDCQVKRIVLFALIVECREVNDQI
jgi:hypothetical protein